MSDRTPDDITNTMVQSMVDALNHREWLHRMEEMLRVSPIYIEMPLWPPEVRGRSEEST